MKKIFTIILALTLFCLTLTSCDAISGLFGGSKNDDTDDTGVNDQPDLDGADVTTPDVEGIVFEDKTVTYDGSEKNVFAANVPEGVRVSYEGNGKINAGEYTGQAKV